MNSDLCIGIASHRDVLELAALEHTKRIVTCRFPATPLGVGAIKVFLAGYGKPMRLAVAGTTALALAFALGNATRLEVFIVSSAVTDQAVPLAHYAARAT